MPLPLIPDRTKMLIDTEYDQDELGGDAREHDADHDTGEARQHQHEAGEWIERHHRQAREHARQAVQRRKDDREPVEHLDDLRRDEAVPLKKVAPFEHYRLPSKL